MPNFGAAVRLNKIPITGIVPEKTTTAPSGPVDGQLWTDTSASPNVLRVYNSTSISWDPWLKIGTAAGTAADGATVLVKANNLSDLASAATARTNLGLGTAATTNTGTGATNTILGNDARLSDTRTPSAGSVVDASVAAGAAIAESKLNLATDAAAGTGSRRTLSLTSATAAMPGGSTLNAIATANAATAAVNLNGQKITGLGAPSAASDAARLQDVQTSAAGIDSKPSVRVASTGNLTVASGIVNGAVIDGVTVATGDRVLLKNQTTAAENGVYVAVASGAAGRDTDAITPNSLWFVEEGTTQGDTSWWVTNNGVISLGTTALVISQFAGPTTYTGTTNRVTVTGTVIDISGSYVGQASITTLGTIGTGVWNGTAVAVAYGGTGATTAAAARTNLAASGIGYAATLGAITAGTPLVVTHNLNTQDVIAQVRDASTNEYVFLDVINASTTTVTVTSGINYGASALRIVVLPVS